MITTDEETAVILMIEAVLASHVDDNDILLVDVDTGSTLEQAVRNLATWRDLVRKAHMDLGI
jgi:hypoxanthine phosphoribosyltransferase